jgi:hypothetical protein
MSRDFRAVFVEIKTFLLLFKIPFVYISIPCSVINKNCVYFLTLNIRTVLLYCRAL